MMVRKAKSNMVSPQKKGLKEDTGSNLTKKFYTILVCIMTASILLGAYVLYNLSETDDEGFCACATEWRWEFDILSNDAAILNLSIRDYYDRDKIEFSDLRITLNSTNLTTDERYVKEKINTQFIYHMDDGNRLLHDVEYVVRIWDIGVNKIMEESTVFDYSTEPEVS